MVIGKASGKKSTFVGAHKSSHSRPPGANRNIIASSSSRNVTHSFASISAAGCVTSRKESLNATGIQKWQTAERLEQTFCLDAMTEMELEELQAIWVLTGNTAMDISHAGGEFEITLDGADDLLGPLNEHPHTHNYHTHRDSTEHRTQGFQVQLPGLVDAYMSWSFMVGDKGLAGLYTPPPCVEVEGQALIHKVDLFYSSTVTYDHLVGDTSIAAALIHQGLMPCAPFLPTTAITFQALKVFRIIHLCSPHLSIHSFMKSLCDIHGPFKPYLSHQFLIFHDLYLTIRREVEARVFSALKRNDPDWRLKHACPPCTYILEGEPKLIFSMLYTVDGNDSLKRIIQRDPTPIPSATDSLGKSAPTSTKSLEKALNMWIHEQVDEWCKEVMEELVPRYNEEDVENPCTERWKNMKAEVTKRMWGVFEEMGLFLALCRHGFVLLLADMVRSGELMLPVQIIAVLLAHSMAHTHNCLCQSRFLAIYIAGLGLEDLEGCEWSFAKSNALASSTQYMSVYHRRQEIWEYFRHTNKFKTYQNPSTFLLNNYKQALALLDTRQTVAATLKKLGANDEETVRGWLKEDEDYLCGLSKEPLQKTREMEYYKLLLTLCGSQEKLTAASEVFNVQTPTTIGQCNCTASQETAQHSMESHQQDLLSVQFMEKQMDIKEAACEKVSRRTYQCCIDVLEGLVVACMFELTKMNMSQTGYSLHKHIANTLKSHSIAIRTALIRAAAKLGPQEVVEYAFLADFDLLRDTRQDIRKRDWAKPATRYAMDQYFKVKCAKEEILHLNVEIPQLTTFICDEELYLLAQEAETQSTNPHLAHQIALQWMETSCFNAHHAILEDIYALKGFTEDSIPQTDKELEEEQVGEDEDVAVMGAFFSVLELSLDSYSTS
ncbi:hypothetical protein BYT27DRAFT_7222762 [Phlegmacium glaucopus]|nr:hypothetical protein BYT27DRAFT_7222762 [Phlegmacium glaucopus]